LVGGWCSKAAVILLVLIAVAGCSEGPTPLARAAKAVEAAGSPRIERVIYREANFLDPEEVLVYLPASATANDAAAVWCGVLLPAGLTDLNTTVWNSAGTLTHHKPTRC
jgi:hypothetical protein